MDTLAAKRTLKKTYQDVRALSYAEKKDEFMNEEKVNAFLDTILDFKTKIKNETKVIYDLNEKIESLTWYSNWDEECIQMLNDLIALCKDLRSSLNRQYYNMSAIRKKGIAKVEIREFKNAINELRETYEDIESVFFFLPQIPEFKETTRKLSLI